MPPRNARTPAPPPAQANAKSERNVAIQMESLIEKMEELHAAEMTQKNRQIAQLMALSDALFVERDDLRAQLSGDASADD